MGVALAETLDRVVSSFDPTEAELREAHDDIERQHPIITSVNRAILYGFSAITAGSGIATVAASAPYVLDSPVNAVAAAFGVVSTGIGVSLGERLRRREAGEYDPMETLADYQ